MNRFLLGCVVALGAIGGLSADEKADKADLKELQGTWVPKSAELGGKPLPADLNTMKMVIKDDTYLVTVGPTEDKGTLKIDASKKPKTIEIVGTEGPNKGKTFPAIYEIKGDKLTVCYDLNGKTAPTEFKTQDGTATLLIVYSKTK
jgi:uncharacterized protein (TIGR03067 family)